ncbi:MAG: hypothetical protein FWD53_02075 [Phycisphaerales bacterium]|nr:hypothetical protein [Phycisphaerales bacterium]
MTSRELWLAIMNYQQVDRVPVVHWNTWEEAHAEWIEQGMPQACERRDGEAAWLGASTICHRIMLEANHLYPVFEEELISETADTRTVRQSDGVVAEHYKHGNSIPHIVEHTLKPDGTGWVEYKRRLRPEAGRIPKDIDERIAAAKAEAGAPVCVNTGSQVGWIRNWIGVEGLAYLCADNLELFQEMSDTITELVLWELDCLLPKAKEKGVVVDCGWCWEDITFRGGPLISPEVFKRVCVPNYRRISQKLYDHGVKLHVVDSDGLIEDLAGLWLDGGVNVMFPLEIGSWQYDPMRLRKKFGREMRLYGGIDKLALTKGRAAIDAEILRRVPLMKEGGYVPLPDHFIGPGTPLADYRYYLKRLGEVRF